jgi:hypothetical protein
MLATLTHGTVKRLVHQLLKLYVPTLLIHLVLTDETEYTNVNKEL